MDSEQLDFLRKAAMAVARVYGCDARVEFVEVLDGEVPADGARVRIIITRPRVGVFTHECIIREEQLEQTVQKLVRDGAEHLASRR